MRFGERVDTSTLSDEDEKLHAIAEEKSIREKKEMESRAAKKSSAFNSDVEEEEEKPKPVLPEKKVIKVKKADRR
jgi:hypothetical protein